MITKSVRTGVFHGRNGRKMDLFKRYFLRFSGKYFLHFSVKKDGRDAITLKNVYLLFLINGIVWGKIFSFYNIEYSHTSIHVKISEII